jgi:hypothetical protein
MSEMLDLAASKLKAWFLAEDGPYSLAIDQGTYLTLDGSFDPAEIVRVVVEAMREPTAAMIVGAREKGRQEFGNPDRGTSAFVAAWHAAIDVALS